MADNIPITAGSGVIVASDDVGGVQVQRVKTTWGLDGVATDVTATTPLPVTPGVLAAPLSSGGADVATSSTLLVAANASRSVLILTNGSDTGMWVTLAALGAANNMGIYLAPGAVWSEGYTGAACAVNVGSGTKRMGVVEL